MKQMQKIFDRIDSIWPTDTSPEYKRVRMLCRTLNYRLALNTRNVIESSLKGFFAVSNGGTGRERRLVSERLPKNVCFSNK